MDQVVQTVLAAYQIGATQQQRAAAVQLFEQVRPRLRRAARPARPPPPRRPPPTRRLTRAAPRRCS
jgi:hypothetical protein